MVARSLDEVRTAFDDPKLAAAFGKQFIDAYAANAFGVLPKREIDLQVFSFLVEHDVVDANGSMYRLARALNLTPTRARTLLFDHQLRNVTEEDTDHAVMIALTTAKYWKDGTNISFGITSPLVKAAIAGKMQDRGVFADVSLSGDILRVDPDHFGDVIDELLTGQQAKRLIDFLRKKGVFTEGQVRSALKKAVKAGAGELISKGSSKGFDAVLKGLKGLASEEGDSSLLGCIIDVGLSVL